MSRPTIADIAQEVGVSVPTVSKVLNGRKDVSPATRAKVEAALVKNQYQRRSGGAIRRASHTNLVELVINEISTPWSLELIRGVERVASKAGVGVVFTELGGEHKPGKQWIDGVLERKPLGVILVLATLAKQQQSQLRSRNIPFVVVDTYGEMSEGVSVVGSNNWNGGLVATRHLIELGHTRIGVISGPQNFPCSRARVDGFRSAHEEAGLEWHADLIRWGDFDLSGGYLNGLALLDRTDRPTALFAGSDYQALGVMKAARRLGLSVPEDLSIVGYDDVPMSKWISPELTTVHQPLQEMAATATDMLLDESRTESGKTTRIDLATHLVVRESTAPLK